MTESIHNGEVVRVLPEYPMFKIAASGNVYGSTGRRLHNQMPDGRYRFTMRLDGRQSSVSGARLVALAWVAGRSAVNDVVDHINGVCSDDRVENLRWTSMRGNAMNMEVHRNGHLQGVTQKANGRWDTKYRNEHGVRKHIGVYDTAEEAHAAYMAKVASLL